MKDLKPQETALLVHIEHSKPIEVSEFVSSLNALNSLYISFVKKNGNNKAMTKSKLYVEKIEEGSIDVFLCELASAAIIPFLENANAIFDFASYVKKVYDYFAKGSGDKPELDYQECTNFHDVLSVVTSDQKGKMEIGAINKSEKGIIFNKCTFNFGDGNGTQRLLKKEAEELKSVSVETAVHERVLMQIYQMRTEPGTDIGNMAIIDEIYQGKKLGVVFATDELKKAILFSYNPSQKAYWVDVKVLTLGGKPKAYNVVALHDTINIAEQEE